MKKFKITIGDESVSARENVPDDAICLLVLAHGAGNDIKADFMVNIQKALAKERVGSFCFNFGYKEKGKKLPGSRKKLNEEYKAVWDYVKVQYSEHSLFAGGKSMGGRVATRVVTELEACKGLVFLGFPLHPPGKSDKEPEPTLFNTQAPMLFLQGSRDPFSNKEAVERVMPKLKTAVLHWLEGGDHSWKTRKKDNRKTEELLEEASKHINAFCISVLKK